MKPNMIECPICGEPCGKQYASDQTSPGFREGKGENFTDIYGVWYCSQECLTTYEDAVGAMAAE